ncbi:uncharacterized protein J4E88_011004 [Alternaria novae-zelandiae]|uniref:uncharacterized protein n=1 Tax=Alternaria triticimaculans TaxID=297637 RepID=UPI0020C3C493|nr:uncharacterized protein J4E78_008401 [Alternaria triticimaculans]XP_049232117.1 uncharacterized protein J4E87_006712 [Alternaria ethzedia]XP_049247315.1 uncharacterized protein J4E84_002671 [Alternaria hordeiaustralica]XP_049249659.1 uncharacterized protein J4E88_011004 [Alternaria novae-zelandiae]XP_051288875.1 uncharacterized protein J4E90_007594 [Alternaria incomplexa]XP_051352016.1 uncharacterized protein J4E92_005994 [Alternaria infectoria]KAI4699016.1 hypothetical protein J4E81_00490
MEKYTDSSSSQGDAENTAFITTPYQSDDRQRRRSYIYLTLFNLFLFTVSMLSLLCSVMSQKDYSGHSAAKLMDQFDIFSPAKHVVEYSHTKFELPNPLNSSKYVGITDDVENAWMDVAYLPDQMVSMEDFPKLQKPADALQVTDPKTGETGYRVGLEVFHQLHCLNLLRMSTYPDYYPKLWWSDTNDKPEKVRAHLDHCIEILRMNLMCLSDVNVFTFHPQEGKEGYWPDYESHHVCRNFDKIKDWANDNAMPDLDV